MINASSRSKVLFVIGLVFAIAFILGEVMDLYTLRLATKTVPVLLMALYLFLQPGKGRFQWLVIIGLLFGAAGDFFLEFSSETFILGLGAFLIGHLFYIFAFLSDCRRPAWGVAIFAYLYGIGVYSFLEMGTLGAGGAMRSMALPVLLYVIVITTMLWRAGARYHAEGVHPLSGAAGFYGALLFTFSDTLLAVSMFVLNLPYSSVLVIITYWLGQLGVTLAARFANEPAPASAQASSG